MNTEYLDLQDKLARLKMTSAKIDRMIDEKTLLLQHYLESKERIDSEIRRIETECAKAKIREDKSTLMGRIEHLGRRLGL